MLQLAARPGGVRITAELMLALGVGRSTVATILLNYARKGLLHRHGAPGHGRHGGGYWYTLTPLGREVLADPYEVLLFASEPRMLTGRIRRFFLANPEEELSHADLALKFNEPLARVHAAVHQLVKRGEVCTAMVVRRAAPALRRAA